MHGLNYQLSSTSNIDYKKKGSIQACLAESLKYHRNKDISEASYIKKPDASSEKQQAPGIFGLDLSNKPSLPFIKPPAAIKIPEVKVPKNQRQKNMDRSK